MVTCYIKFMLTRRTNVLLTEEDYLLLKRLSRKKRVTVGKLVREAVRKTFGGEKTNEFLKLLAEARKIGRKAKISPKEWKELINEGRKW